MRHDLGTVFQKELNPGERILWSSKPKGGIRLHSWDIFMIPVTIAWSGAAIFLEFIAIVSGELFLAILLIPFVLVGLYLLFGRFLIDATYLEKTYYALTNKRIIIIAWLFNQKRMSIDLKNLSDIGLVDQKRDGSGTITFYPPHPILYWTIRNVLHRTGLYYSVAYNFLGFKMIDEIENAKEVYDKIINARKEALRR